MHKRFLLLLLLLFLAGCTSFGPTAEPGYLARTSSALPPGVGEIQMSGPGLWAPGANGFSGLMQQAQPVQGSLVISAKGVYFQQWIKAEGRYDTIAAIPYTEISAVRKEEFGRNLRVILKRKDLSVVSFSFIGEKHQLVDLAKTAKAFDLVNSAVGGGT